MKNNFEKYLSIHEEIMTRLENGEITTETAKEVNDLAFNKYIVSERAITPLTDKSKWVFNNDQSSNSAKKVFDLLCKLDKIEVEYKESIKGKTANEISKIESAYKKKQNAIQDQLENDFNDKDYNAGHLMYNQRFHRNRLRKR